MAAPDESITRSPRELIFGRSRWNILLGIMAVIFLLGSFSALAYTTFNQKESKTVLINGRDYQWDTLNEEFDTIFVQGYEGVPLPVILADAGIDDPASHEYRLMAGDGYLKTVSWRDMETGILSMEGDNDHDHMVIFETKAKAYWVYDLVEIEVV